MTPLTYSMEEAAERLGYGFTVDWLKHRIKDLPHIKTGGGHGRGGRVGFTEAHLAEILLMNERRPEGTGHTTPDEFRSIVSRRSA